MSTRSCGATSWRGAARTRRRLRRLAVRRAAATHLWLRWTPPTRLRTPATCGCGMATPAASTTRSAGSSTWHTPRRPSPPAKARRWNGRRARLVWTSRPTRVWTTAASRCGRSTQSRRRRARRRTGRCGFTTTTLRSSGTRAGSVGGAKWAASRGCCTAVWRTTSWTRSRPWWWTRCRVTRSSTRGTLCSTGPMRLSSGSRSRTFPRSTC
mmetsp:Transcript_24011/g.71224  ORF Transcript_24011/g.71224 Transcript_24011/m.71224 type:complete len:210 (+) Transcript_24011:534-1163(+)